MFKNWKKKEIDKYSENTKGRTGNKKENNKDPEKARILRKLKHKTKYLDIEYEEAENLLSRAKKQFILAISRYCKNNPTAKNPLKLTEPGGELQKKEIKNEEEVKVIFREIVKATHPDKNPNAGQRKKDMFINATSAKEKNNIEDLISISFDLNIDISGISIELIEEIEHSLIEKEKEIKEMRGKLEVTWFTSDKDKRFKLIQTLCPKNDKEK